MDVPEHTTTELDKTIGRATSISMILLWHTRLKRWWTKSKSDLIRLLALDSQKPLSALSTSDISVLIKVKRFIIYSGLFLGMNHLNLPSISNKSLKNFLLKFVLYYKKTFQNQGAHFRSFGIGTMKFDFIFFKFCYWIKQLLTGYSFWDGIIFTNLHSLFCQFISWTNWVNSEFILLNLWTIAEYHGKLWLTWKKFMTIS